MLAAWGVDGHNSHTNVCSSGASRTGYPVVDGHGPSEPGPRERAQVILLVRSRTWRPGHYFNPHAQRIIEGKQNGAKLIVLDARLSNTATHADRVARAVPGEPSRRSSWPSRKWS